MTIDLRLGDWREVLADVECDTLISDPPYGKETHEGWNAGEKQVRSATGQSTRTAISYDHWTPADVKEFVASWSPRVRGWIACMTSDDLIPTWKAAFSAAGRYPFAPVPIKQVRPRLLGDGPASWFVYLMVARPRNREFATWGCLRGGYDSHSEKRGVVAGAKPVELMREIVKDYSRPGDLVVDPCSGGATTLLAAKLEGRRAIGAEVVSENYEKAKARCSELPVETSYSAQRVLF